MGRKIVLQKDFTGLDTVKVDKLECASRQIDSAIFLYFNTDDFVSIHTLAYAACEILDALLKAKGIKSFSDIRDENIKPEFQREAALHFSEAANFFKHETKDTKAELQFAPAVNNVILGIGGWALKALGHPYTPNRLVFLIWARAHMPNHFAALTPEMPEAVSLIQSFEVVRETYPLEQKQAFYRDFIGTLNTPVGARFASVFGATGNSK